MKKFSFFIFFILVNLAAFSQQEPLFSNYMLSRPITNPGFTGADNTINAIFTNRTMFAGFGTKKSETETLGIPVTSVFGVEAPVEIFGLRSGLGLVVVSDEIGFTENVNVDFTYSYHHSLDYGTLGFGLKMGFNNYSINGKWTDLEGDYWTPSSSDQLVPDQFSDMTFGLGAGAYFETPKYYLGLSVSKVNSPEIVFAGNNKSEQTLAFYSPHYYLMGAYNIGLPDPLFDLRPSFLLRTDLSAYILDMNGTLYYKSKYWAGIGTRVSPTNLAAINILAGTELLNGLMLGYALDINTSYMMLGGGALSHEITVSYSFNIDAKRDQKYKSVRYL